MTPKMFSQGPRQAVTYRSAPSPFAPPRPDPEPDTPNVPESRPEVAKNTRRHPSVRLATLGRIGAGVALGVVGVLVAQALTGDALAPDRVDAAVAALHDGLDSDLALQSREGYLEPALFVRTREVLEGHDARLVGVDVDDTGQEVAVAAVVPLVDGEACLLAGGRLRVEPKVAVHRHQRFGPRTCSPLLARGQVPDPPPQGSSPPTSVPLV